MNVAGYRVWRDRGSLERRSVWYRTFVKSIFVFNFPPQFSSSVPLEQEWAIHFQKGTMKKGLLWRAAPRSLFNSTLLYLYRAESQQQSPQSALYCKTLTKYREKFNNPKNPYEKELGNSGKEKRLLNRKKYLAEAN